MNMPLNLKHLGETGTGLLPPLPQHKTAFVSRKRHKLTM